jgi:folate-dependent phosphoribosylglycinamide formyltransferase PurN
MRGLIYASAKSGGKMNIVCFISGSGTNYREIVNRDPNHHYLVFTNRPGCGGTSIARANQHPVIELSHIPYLKEARQKYGAGNVPRNTPERLAFEKEAVRLIENKLGKEPDVVCLAGYNQWNTDWFVDHYYPRILNVHPGDTTKGYDGLHWIPAAKAILAGDAALRSTLFIVDKSFDKGPVLVQSAPLDIVRALRRRESAGTPGLLAGLKQVKEFAREQSINTYSGFKDKAGEDLTKAMELVCTTLQDELKVSGDWKIFPFAVHDLIARGRASIEGRTVFMDGKALPEYGFRLDDI